MIDYISATIEMTSVGATARQHFQRNSWSCSGEGESAALFAAERLVDEYDVACILCTRHTERGAGTLEIL